MVLEDSEVSDTPTAAWLITCTILCLAIVAYSVVMDRDATGSIAYQIGYNLPLAAIFGGLLYLVFKRRVAGKIGWLGAGVIFFALMAGSFIAAARQQSEMRQMAMDLKKTFGAVESNIESGKTLPVPAVSGGSSEAAKVGAVVNKMVARSMGQRQEYDRDLEAIGWSSILDAKRLVKDKSFDESRSLLSKARTVMDKYAGQTYALYAGMRSDIENSDLGPNAKAAMLEGFNRSETSSKNNAAKVWDLERQALDEIEKAIAGLHGARGYWLMEQNQLAFKRQQDLEQFNAHMSRVQELVAEQQAIQTKAVKKAQSRMDAMGR